MQNPILSQLRADLAARGLQPAAVVEIVDGLLESMLSGQTVIESEGLQAEGEALEAGVFEDESANDPDVELEVRQSAILETMLAADSENISDLLVNAEDFLDGAAAALSAKFMVYFEGACLVGRTNVIEFDDDQLTCFASPEIADDVADRLEEILLPEFKKNGKICVVMADLMWIQRQGFDERYQFTVLIQDSSELTGVDIEVLTDADEDDVVADRLDDGVAVALSGGILEQAVGGTLIIMATNDGNSISVDVTSSLPVPTPSSN